MCTQKSSLWIFFLTPPKCSHKTEEKKYIYLECGFKVVNLGEIMQFLALMNANSSTPQKMHTNSQVEVTKKNLNFSWFLFTAPMVISEFETIKRRSLFDSKGLMCSINVTGIPNGSLSLKRQHLSKESHSCENKSFFKVVKLVTLVFFSGAFFNKRIFPYC